MFFSAVHLSIQLKCHEYNFRALDLLNKLCYTVMIKSFEYTSFCL